MVATSNITLCESLRTNAAHFANVSDTEDTTSLEWSCKLTFDELWDVLDQRNISDNCIALDCTYGDFIDPFAFRATTKENNPNVVSRGEMIKYQINLIFWSKIFQTQES